MKGQSLVEFALIVPLMLLLLAATVDLGRLFYSRITVSDAARAGAMEAARSPGSFQPGTACTSANKDTNAVMCRVLQEAAGGFVTVAPADVEVTCTGGTCVSNATLGATVSVKVTGHFTLVTPIIGFFFGGQTIDFSSTASAQRQVAPNVAAPQPPVASFNASPLSGVAPLTVTLSNTSTGGATSYLWDFGDTQTSTVASPPPHTYPQGTYTITLSASNAGGTTSYNVVINVSAAIPAAPVADFTATPMTGAAPLNVTFTDTSTGAPATWAWTFGDGGTSNLPNPPMHTYNSIGTYTVTLTVQNAGGSSTRTRTINAGLACLAPAAGFTVTPALSLIHI